MSIKVKDVGACCVGGFQHEGTPVGTVEIIAGHSCYVSIPSEPTDKIVVIAGDVFGYTLNNVRLIADQYAKEGFKTIVPNLFYGSCVSFI